LRSVPRTASVSDSGLAVETFSRRRLVLRWPDIVTATRLDGQGSWQGVRQLRLSTPTETIILVSVAPCFSLIDKEVGRRLSVERVTQATWGNMGRWFWAPGLSRQVSQGEERPETVIVRDAPHAATWNEKRRPRLVALGAASLLFVVGGVLYAATNPLVATLYFALLFVTLWGLWIALTERCCRVTVGPTGLSAVTYSGRRVDGQWGDVRLVERLGRCGRRVHLRSGRVILIPFANSAYGEVEPCHVARVIDAHTSQACETRDASPASVWIRK
jgi:hypothetical protein